MEVSGGRISHSSSRMVIGMKDLFGREYRKVFPTPGSSKVFVSPHLFPSQRSNS